MRYTREQQAAHRTVRDISLRHYVVGWGVPKEARRHPLGGLSVREFVAEAREGWPKVPVPTDPYKAAQRVLSNWHPSMVDVEWME